MRLTKIRRFQRLTDALKAGIEDVEATWHGSYINFNDPDPSMTKTVIRHAAPADFDDLLEIDRASFPGGVAYDASELSYFMNRVGAETVVAEQDGRVIAFIILEVHPTRRSATIVTLDVREAHRRAGHGTQLLQRAERILRDYGVEAYDLQVDITNTGAIGFYRKHGFQKMRTLRRYYANGNDAYLMVKEL